MNTTQLATVPGYGNCLARIEKYVSDHCIYLKPLTGKFTDGLITVSKSEIIPIPDSDNLTIVKHVWGNEPLNVIHF